MANRQTPTQYMHFTSRDNGPSYEAWAQGNVHLELFVDGQLVLFANYIDIDGDGEDDLSVALTIEGIINQGDGWGVETSGGIIPIIGEIMDKSNIPMESNCLDQSRSVVGIHYNT